MLYALTPEAHELYPIAKDIAGSLGAPRLCHTHGHWPRLSESGTIMNLAYGFDTHLAP